MIEQERSSRMTVPDDHVAARTQVVRVYIAELIGPDALYPHRRPAANVGTVPWTVPVLTRRPPGRGAELREPVRLRVPGPRGEVVEAVEAVVLVPDEPAPGVGGPRLIELRIGERLDPGYGARPRIDLADAGEPPRVDRPEERVPVTRERERDE